MNIQQAIDLVAGSPASIFTRQDVLSLLSRVEAGGAPAAGYTWDEVLGALRSAADSMRADDLVDLDSAVLHLDGNQVSLGSVDIDRQGLYDELVESVSLALSP